MNFFKQPLLHFLMLGALVFVAYHWWEGGAVEEDGVVVNENTFLEFIQYRNRGIGAESAEKFLTNLSPEHRKSMLEKHVQEEVLYHEALNLGLDKKDYVIKQRLIQKMEYLLDGASAEHKPLDNTEVQQYYDKNKARYFSSSTVTFTHVYINPDLDKGDPQQRAKALKKQLNDNNIPFEKATQFGDRFVYYANYVERDSDFVASHFGKAFADQVFSQTPSNEQWIGPIRSDYGWHLLKLVNLQPGGIPTLAEIYNKVAQDALLEKTEQERKANIQKLIDTYKLDLATLQQSQAIDS